MKPCVKCGEPVHNPHQTDYCPKCRKENHRINQINYSRTRRKEIYAKMETGSVEILQPGVADWDKVSRSWLRIYQHDLDQSTRIRIEGREILLKDLPSGLIKD